MKIDQWATVHQWRKLVNQGIAKPLTAADGTPYIIQVNEDLEPIFWNPSDDSYMKPGAWWWENLRDLIDQAELDGLGNAVLS